MFTHPNSTFTEGHISAPGGCPLKQRFIVEWPGRNPDCRAGRSWLTTYTASSDGQPGAPGAWTTPTSSILVDTNWHRQRPVLVSSRSVWWRSGEIQQENNPSTTSDCTVQSRTVKAGPRPVSMVVWTLKRIGSQGLVRQSPNGFDDVIRRSIVNAGNDTHTAERRWWRTHRWSAGES